MISSTAGKFFCQQQQQLLTKQFVLLGNMADVNIENVKIESDTSSAEYHKDEFENLSQALSDSVDAKFGNSAQGIKNMITNMRKVIVEDGANDINDISDGYSVPERAQVGVVEAEIGPHVSQIHKAHDLLNNHKCDQCDASFSLRESLQNHVNAVHELLKNHKCSQCERSFSLRHHLQNHISRKHLKLNEFTK